MSYIISLFLVAIVLRARTIELSHKPIILNELVHNLAHKLTRFNSNGPERIDDSSHRWSMQAWLLLLPENVMRCLYLEDFLLKICR